MTTGDGLLTGACVGAGAAEPPFGAANCAHEHGLLGSGTATQ